MMTMRFSTAFASAILTAALLFAVGCGRKRSLNPQQAVVTTEDTSSPRGKRATVQGRVTDEEGKPLGGVKWWISAREKFSDGRWGHEMRTGIPARKNTDKDGRFLLTVPDQVRYDLQFEKYGFAPAFLFRVSAEASRVDVTMRRGQVVRGVVARLIDGRRKPLPGTRVELRLPTRDVWYAAQAITDSEGRFEFRVCPPPLDPSAAGVTCSSKTCPEPKRSKWQVVCAGEIVELDVREGEQVESIDFQLAIRVTRGKSGKDTERPQ